MAESLRGQLNSSFNRSSAHVLKSVPVPGGGWDVRKFSTWTATCVAGIGQVPDTVADRSVVIRLERKMHTQAVKRLRARDGGELRERAQDCPLRRRQRRVSAARPAGRSRAVNDRVDAGAVARDCHSPGTPGPSAAEEPHHVAGIDEAELST
jgi:hypothetical protein